MEETSIEVETFTSPPRRRRSTFFERRDSIVPQTQTENVDPNTSKCNTKDAQKSNQELASYHDELLSEKEQWKKEVKNRRHKYHDLRQQYKIAVQTPGRSRMCYSALSNEDIEFLKAKTNISKLIEAENKLHKSVKETRALLRRASELDDVILDDCERKVREITEYILENSTVEPMDSQ